MVPGMTLELTAGLVAFVAVAVWRFAHRRRSSPSRPLPHVGNAPALADPVTRWRYNDDGLGMHLPLSSDEPKRDNEGRAE